MRTRWLRRLALLAVAVAAVAAGRAWLLTPDVVPVTVHRVSRGTVQATVSNSKAGTVKSRLRATLSPEIGGRVDALPVRKGQRVSRGQVLLRIHDSEYRAESALRQRALEVAEAGRSEACQNAEHAVREARRTEQLVAEGIASPQLLDQHVTARALTEAACGAASARVAQAQAALDAARVALAKTILRAPFDGIVADLRVEVGEWITPSPPGLPIPPVIEVFDDQRIYVSAPLDEVDLARVQRGMAARVTLDAHPGASLPGRVVALAAFVDDREAQNRTFEIEVEVDAGAAQRLLPGSSADVEVILEVRDDVLRIPSYALMQGDRVMVVRDGVLAAAAVTPGLRNWDFVEIVSGLEEGQLVVVSLDRAEVVEGARVRTESEAPR